MNDPNRIRKEEHLTPAQAYFITSMKKFLWFCAGRGCFTPGTEIKMFDGSVKHVEDIKVGDALVGDDMNPRFVMSLTDGYDDMYKITLQDGSSYGCNYGHDFILVDKKDDEIKRIPLKEVIGKESDYHHIRVIDGKPTRQDFTILFTHHGKYYGFNLDGNNRLFLENGIITAQSGKTRIGSRWIYKNVLKYPRARGMIAANTYNQLHSATLPPVLAYFREIGLEYRVNKRPPESWLKRSPVELAEYKNVLTVETGAHVFLRSLDNYDYIRGIEFGWAWIDEISSTSKEAWDVIVGCLRDPECEDRMIRVTGTPDGDNWTWREFEKKWSKDPIISKMYDIVFMSSRENPFLPEEFLDMMLASYDRRTALQEIDGRVLIDNESLIYYEWRPKYHMKQIKPYDPNLPLIMCWDFNSSDSSPMSMILAQQHYYSDGTPFVQVIDEIVIMSGNTPMVCEEFVKRYNRKHNSEIYVYGDRTGTTNKSVGINDYGMIMECLSPYFPRIVMRNVKKNMGEKDRRASMNSMLLNSKGQIRMFINPKCLELIKDFDELKPDKFGKINKSDLKRSHTSDALGYYIAKEFPVITKKGKDDGGDMKVNLGLR